MAEDLTKKMKSVSTSVFIPKKINITSKVKSVDKPIIQPVVDLPQPINLLDEIIPDTTNPIIETVTDAAKKAVDTVVPGAGVIIDTVAPAIFKGFRIEKLPQHDEDFATKWFYSAQDSLVPENITIEFNAYLQALKELKDGELKLPEGFDGPTIAYDLQTYIMQDFRTSNQKYSPDDNLIHRAWFAHCAKRAIDSIRQGEFRGEDGYTKQYPQIADILDRRVNEIIMQATLFK